MKITGVHFVTTSPPRFVVVLDDTQSGVHKMYMLCVRTTITSGTQAAIYPLDPASFQDGASSRLPSREHL